MSTLSLDCLCINADNLIDTFVIAFPYSTRVTVLSLGQIIISWTKHAKLSMPLLMRNLLPPQSSRNLLRLSRILNSLQRTCNNNKCWHSSSRWSSSRDSSLWPSSKLWHKPRPKRKHKHKLKPRCKLRDKDTLKPTCKLIHKVFLSPMASVPPCRMLNKCFHRPMVLQSNSNFRHMRSQGLEWRWPMRTQMPMVVSMCCSNSNMRRHLNSEQLGGCQWAYRNEEDCAARIAASYPHCSTRPLS